MAEEEDLAAVPATDSETTCSLCYAEFLEAEDLVVHFNQVHKADCSLHCQFCTSMFPSLDSYALHIRNVHLLSLRACKYCNKLFVDSVSHKKHQIKHQTPQKSVRCSQCSCQFSNLYELQQHELKNHDNDTDGVLLDFIFPMLSSCLNIKALNFIQSFDKNAAYICTSCVFTSPLREEYITHLHQNKCRSIVCDKCCNVYKDRKGILKHFEKHKECYIDVKEEELNKQCPRCEKTINLFIYNDHVKKCKPIKCNLCNIFLHSLDDMTHHQSTDHPMAITMTRCKFCHKEFVGNTAVQKHIDKKHKPEFHLYKYKCVYCENMFFKHPQRLFCHYFSKHIDLQPYCCKICNMTFRIRKKFTIHIKLTHKSVGFVEFDENYHVFFTEKKSENPFVPKSLFIDKRKGQIETIDMDAEQNELLNAQTDAPTDIPTDVPTDCQTDIPTDTEETKKSLLERKPPKIRFKEQKKSKQLDLITIKTEVQSEPNQSEYETRAKTKSKHKKNKRSKKRKMLVADDSDSEDEPLIKIQRKSKARGVISKWNMKKTDVKLGIKKRFTCNICKKYCYTFQNYNHHMSLHFKDEVKKCVKCGEQFSSKKELNQHVEKEHSSSRLTDTLRNLLERRKKGKNGEVPEIPRSEKFRRTIKRVRAEPSTAIVAAKITEVKDKLSVKNFLETFTPEEREESAKKEKPVHLHTSVTIKTLNRKIMRPPAIKMTKFVPKPQPTNIKLSMPVRYKPVNTEKTKINIKLVQNVYITDDVPYYGHDDDQDHHYDYEEETQTKNETVPEVAQEVMLESQEQQRAPIMPHKIVIPKLPKNYSNDDIKIAHLLPVAPFYKIVKMKDVLENKDSGKKNQEENMESSKEDSKIKLPGGTKLVNVNPLAHLLGNTPVEKIIPSNKHYKPKMDNFEKAVAKALLKLEQNTNNRKKKKNRAEMETETIETLEIEQ